MQNRIDRLEGLVLSLMGQSSGPAAATAAISASASSETGGQNPNVDFDEEDMDAVKYDDEESDTEQVTKSLGVLKVDNQRSYYISDAHWTSLLNDVRRLFIYFFFF